MNGRRLLAALILVIPLAACAMPGASTPIAPQPAPSVDAASIEAMVAATVSAVVALTEQFAPTPAPASVIIIAEAETATPQPTPTTIPTNSPTPQAASPTESSLSQQQDSSLLFVDARAGCEMTLPAGWLAVRVNEKEYLDAFSLAEAANEHIQQALLGVQNEDPLLLRLFAIDTQPKHIQNEFVSDMRFTLDSGKTIALNSDADLQAIAAALPASATAFRFEAVSVRVFAPASGVQTGVIESKSAFENAAGETVSLYRRQAFFNTKGGVFSITLTTLEGLKDSLLPAFDAMLETIKLIP